MYTAETLEIYHANCFAFSSYIQRERERQTDRQTDRQRQRERQTERETDRQRQRETETERQAGSHTEVVDESYTMKNT